ncbi:sialidase family protein [Nitrospira sp. Nam80]
MPPGRRRREIREPLPGDLMLVRSTDGGETFESPVVVNDDGQSIGHSFETIAVGSDDDIYVAWLDNRHKQKSGAGILFVRSRDAGKAINPNVTVDGMACPCCRPTSVMAPDASVWLSWRKTFDGNVRDIVLNRVQNGNLAGSSPVLVHEDGWVFSACPHRGPSLGLDKFGRLYVAWYTEGTDETPRLLFATSDDSGKTFSEPISLHTSVNSLPDQLRMAVHPDGMIMAVWEDITGVRKRIVMRVSTDRGKTFGAVRPVSGQAKAQNPTAAMHENGTVAISWNEHEWPHNRVVVRWGRLDR